MLGGACSTPLGPGTEKPDFQKGNLMKSDRKSIRGIFIAVVALLASGCGSGEQAHPSLLAAPSAPIFEGAEDFDNADKIPHGAGMSIQGMGYPAWGPSPERRVWANAVLRVIRARQGDFDKARDKEIFCPGYSSASASQRANCWLMLVAAISKFESGFKPASKFREPNGVYSVGMLALSPGECPNAPSMVALQAALPNLVCGTNKMASLIARYGYVDGPASSRGASRYWSTLRAPYKRWDPTRSRYLNLGKRNQILPLVRGFRGQSALLGLSVDASAVNFEDESDDVLGIDGFGYHDGL